MREAIKNIGGWASDGCGGVQRNLALASVFYSAKPANSPPAAGSGANSQYAQQAVVVSDVVVWFTVTGPHTTTGRRMPGVFQGQTTVVVGVSVCLLLLSSFFLQGRGIVLG